MTARFPLQACRHKGKNDQPPEPDSFAIFDAHGYWAELAGICFKMPANVTGNRSTVKSVTQMLNAAYLQGQEDAKRAIRDPLGIENEI